MTTPKRPRRYTARQPHDRLVQYAFSQPEHAAGLLKAVLHPDVAAAVAWSTVKLENRSFVSRALRGRHLDLLFSAKLHGEPIYFYCLVEQQRDVEKLMIARMGVYAFRAWDAIVAADPTPDEIPLIVPILIHHSKTGWTAAIRFQDVVALPDALRPLLAPHTPHFEMALVDLSPGQAARIAEGMLTAFGVFGGAPGPRACRGAGAANAGGGSAGAASGATSAAFSRPASSSPRARQSSLRRSRESPPSSSGRF